jgi:hypothetical protein
MFTKTRTASEGAESERIQNLKSSQPLKVALLKVALLKVVTLKVTGSEDSCL